MDRNTYCRDCDRSIWGNKSCDVNVEDNGYFNLSDEKCYCKVVNGIRAEKYPWEVFERDTTPIASDPDLWTKKQSIF